jgi:hypothetical protein
MFQNMTYAWSVDTTANDGALTALLEFLEPYEEEPGLSTGIRLVIPKLAIANLVGFQVTFKVIATTAFKTKNDGSCTITFVDNSRMPSLAPSQGLT